MTAKRSAKETLEAIAASEESDEVERILNLSDNELDRELAEAGFDPAAVRAKGEALAKEGLLRLEYGGVTIVDLERLRHYGE